MRAGIFIIILLLILPAAAAQFISIPDISAPQITPVLKITPIVLKICNDGDTQCDGRRFQMCLKNKWQTKDKCSGFEKCDQNKGCVKTTPQATIERITKTPTPIQRAVPRKISHGVIPAATPRTRLTCPKIPKTPLFLPKPPYDAKFSDCSLIGKSKEIEKYLQELEVRTAKCYSRRAQNWQNVLDVRKKLDKQIDELEIPKKPSTPSGGFTLIELLIEIECMPYPVAELLPSAHSPLKLATKLIDYEHYKPWFSKWLSAISYSVHGYCQKIDELVEPVLGGCNEINYYLGCEKVTAEHKKDFHSILSSKMSKANDKYQDADAAYLELQTLGFKKFRKYFNEKLIDCPSQLAPAKFRVIQRPRVQGFVDYPQARPSFLRRFINWFGFS